MPSKLVLLLTCSLPLLAFLVAALRDLGSDTSAIAALIAGGGAKQQGAGGTKRSQGGAHGGGKLRFRPDGTFKILQITDLHYGEDAAKDAKSDDVRLAALPRAPRAALASLPPCLVLLAGSESRVGGGAAGLGGV